MVTRKAAALAAALTGAAVLAGCSATPGVAARTDDRSISQERLEQTQRDLSTIVAEPEAGPVLLMLVVAPIYIEAAAENGVGVSEDEARTVIEENAIQAGLDPVPEFGEGAVEVVRFTMAAQAVQGLDDADEVFADIQEQVGALDLDINPRYGTLDTTQMSIAPEPLPWIVSQG